MSSRSRRPRPLYVAALLLAGCAAPPEPPQQTAAKLFKARTNFDLPGKLIFSNLFTHASAPGPGVALTSDRAVEIALLNNQSLAAQLSEMGVSQADYQMAAQVPNPSFYIAFRPPDRRPPGESAVDVEATAAEDVLGILLLPLKKKIAAGQMQQSAVRSADAALQLVHDVRVAMAEVQRVQALLKLDQQYTDAAEAAADFADRMRAAGNVSDMERAERRAEAAQAKMDQLDTQAELADRREAVNRLLGLSDDKARWTAADLPTLPPVEQSPADADVATAARDRLDLQMAQVDVDTAERNAKLAGITVLPQVNVGVDMERTTNKQTVVGPSIGFEVPIFNQHQGEIAKAKAQLTIARQKLEATKVDIAADVRSAAARRATAREQVDLAIHTLVPEREAATVAMQQHYNGMLVGLYQLLSEKQLELNARRTEVRAVARYWVAQADWSRAIGK